jgi:uncharacterized Zn finger protein (UPF0148 family)
MPKTDAKTLLMILGGPMGGKKGRSCPECESPLESDGCCSECGYGEEEGEYEEEGGEEEGKDMHNERMIELRDDLQRVVDKLSKLIS